VIRDRVSWETCPVCSGKVEIGWLASAPAGTAEPAEEAVESDCPNGRDLTDVQLYAFAHTLPAAS
jgi:hypothetical protein